MSPAEKRKARIEREYLTLGVKPWQFAPSEIDDGPCPYKEGSIAARSWKQAQQQRKELRERDPNYFRK